MDKNSFFAGLKQRLYGLPEAEIKKVSEYYNEMIEDRMEDGYTEEEAVLALGPMEQIVENALYDQSISHLVAANMRGGEKDRVQWGKILLAILSSPIWLPLVLAGFALFIALAGTIIALFAAFCALLLAFAIAAVASVVSGFIALFNGSWIPALFSVGIGLVLAGLLLILLPYLGKAYAWYAQLMQNLFRFIKKPFVKKMGGRS